MYRAASRRRRSWTAPRQEPQRAWNDFLRYAADRQKLIVVFGEKPVRQDASGRVFFVDDEPRICRVVRRTLERQGVIVRCFSNAADCLAELEVALCDVLITDVKMPGMDGIELLAEVRRRYPGSDVTFLTGGCRFSLSSSTILSRRSPQ